MKHSILNIDTVISNFVCVSLRILFDWTKNRNIYADRQGWNAAMGYVIGVGIPNRMNKCIGIYIVIDYTSLG